MPNPHLHQVLDDMNPRTTAVPSKELMRANIISWAEEKIKETKLREQMVESASRLRKLEKEIEGCSTPGPYVVKISGIQYVVTVDLDRSLKLQEVVEL